MDGLRDDGSSGPIRGISQPDYPFIGENLNQNPGRGYLGVAVAADKVNLDIGDLHISQAPIDVFNYASELQ